MRSWERALTSSVAGVVLLACSGGGGDSSGGGRFNNPPAPKAGTTGGAQAGTGSAGMGSGDFGNTDGGMTQSFDDVVNDAGNGVNTSNNPDDQKCGGDKFTPEVMTEIIPGNILFVFDKSGSMDEEWGTAGHNKWADAIAAIPAALMPLQEQVTVGSIFFPLANTDEGECAVPAAGMAPHIALKPGADFLADWANLGANGVGPGGRTPLRIALMVTDQYLQAELPNLVGITSVVIVTDGNPNCADGVNGDDTSPNLTPFLANWLTLGVKTYVVGLPGLDGSGLTILADLATAGGTTQYIPADDPMTLQTELAKIVSENVTTNFDTCTLPLDKQPPDINKVNLVVVNQGQENSVARDLGMDGGWTIDAEGKNVILQGRFCDLAKSGEYDEITVVFGCTEAPPLPPLPPPI